MNVNVNDTKEGTIIEVLLSERNLEDLNRLWEAYKERNALPFLYRVCKNNMALRVVIEPNETHYAERTPGIGADFILGPRNDAA